MTEAECVHNAAMSAKSKWIERIFRLAGVSKPQKPRAFYKKLRKNAIEYKKGEKIPSRVSGVRVDKNVYCGMVYYTFVPQNVESGSSVLYLHGSGYMNAHKKAQERFAAEIAKNVHSKVFFPIYPKLPICTARACHAVLNNFYHFLQKQGRVCMVGDSSGASLCLIMSEGKAEANAIVAISPWLDAELTGIGFGEQKKDVFLSADRLRYIAKLWAYDLPLSSSEMSPLNGSFEGKEILLFCGENEIFLPSVRAFYERCKKNGKVRVEYYEGKDQPHDYPLLQTIEGREARKIVFDTLIRFVYAKQSLPAEPKKEALVP